MDMQSIRAAAFLATSILGLIMLFGGNEKPAAFLIFVAGMNFNAMLGN